MGRARRGWCVFLAFLAGLVLMAAGCRGNPEVTSARDLDLPVVEVSAGAPADARLAVLLSGDGGWSAIDRSISAGLAAKGVAVVGLNSLRYFWRRRTPEEASRDLARIITHYLSAWRKQRVILMGYSLGADALPLMANRLSPEILQRADLIVLVGAAKSYELEFHLSEWIPWVVPKGDSTFPELLKLRGKKILCFHGAEERESLCPELPDSLATSILLPGDHHFGRHYGKIVGKILSE